MLQEATEAAEAVVQAVVKEECTRLVSCLCGCDVTAQHVST